MVAARGSSHGVGPVLLPRGGSGVTQQGHRDGRMRLAPAEGEGDGSPYYDLDLHVLDLLNSGRVQLPGPSAALAAVPLQVRGLQGSVGGGTRVATESLRLVT